MLKTNKGIIALFPAIIISSLLLILCVEVSQSLLALLYRDMIFAEKSQSDISLASCTLRVSAKQLQNAEYSGGNQIMIGDDFCDVGIFSASAANTINLSVKINDAESTKNVAEAVSH